MSFLLVTIVLNTLLGIIFKYFAIKQINILHAIIFNYCVCSIIGWLYYGNQIVEENYHEKDWAVYALLMGSIFILGFVSAAKSVGLFGLGITSVMQRISMILTVMFSVIVWDETLSLVKVIGLLIAILAILMVNQQTRTVVLKNKWWVLLPVLTLLFSGIIDSGFFHIKRSFGSDLNDGIFTTFIFNAAMIWGLGILAIQKLNGTFKFQRKSILAGVILGIPNFFSVITLIRAIDSGFDASFLFPIYNMGIIFISGLTGILILGEKAYLLSIVGFILALLSILLISLDSFVV
jgi:uncharacterized membrane protein